MVRTGLLLAVPFWMCFGASSALAASDSQAEAPKPSAKPMSSKLVISSPQTSVQQFFDLDLRRWPEERFYENLTDLINELSLRHGAEATAVLLDTAELFLGQMMMSEAESVLSGLKKVTSAQEPRQIALHHARLLLNGEGVPDFESSPLSQSGRPDHAFWAVMQAIATTDGRLLSTYLADGITGLSYQTRPVVRAVLPIMIEAMIETDHLDLAARSLRILADFPELNKSSMGHYLRGRAAELRNNESTALSHYFIGVKGFDRYAVRCRLAIAGLALEDGGRGALMAAEDVLASGMDAWRGDQFEVAALEKLTEVYMAAEEDVEALILLSKIILRYPGTKAAEKAEAQAHTALRAVYQKGFDGEIPLARWLTVHLRLVPAFRFHPQYAQMVEELGDHLLALGGTSMAAMEYRRALEFREGLRQMRAPSATPEDFSRNRLKLARAYVMGGQYKEAKQTLAMMEDVSDPKERNKINALKAKVAAQMNDTDGLLRTHVMSPSAENLRNVSRALWETQDWPAANEFYNRLWAEYPGSFDISDASYLLIAAHRIGDRNSATRVAEAFPGLTDSEDWVRLAQSFLTEPPDVSLLTLDAANDRLNRLSSALDSLEGNGL